MIVHFLVLACAFGARTDAGAHAAAAVLRREFPSVARAFRFQQLAATSPLAYEYSAKNGLVTVRGASGVAMCRGAYDYLRRTLGAQATWAGATLGAHGPKLPDAPATDCTSPYRWVLQDNVCVFGYTTAFYGWKQWQRYLDVMALHGVNMQFSPIGGEAIWARTWKSFGFTQRDLDGLFTGPAFLPWHRMGNVYKHDGPLPQSYLDGSIKLEKKILARMRELGIEPVAPGFAGFVPPGFTGKFPQEKVIHVAPWAGFEGDCRAWILHPLSKMYARIGGRFIDEWRKEFGPAHYYLADSFNELEVPVSPDRPTRLQELAAFGRSVYEGIKAGDPEGTWVMQGWLFFNAGRFWDDESVAALLQDVPNDKMMILDLFAEAAPVWKAHQAFHGKQWIVSTVTTWGGNNQPYGNFDAYSRLSADTLAAPNHGALSGFGISFEGSESNTAQFELLCDSAWSREPINVQEFLAETCVRSRYGGTSPRAVGAWKLFAESAYHRGFGIHPNHLLQGRPSDLSPTAKGAACDDPQFRQGVESLLAARDALGANPLYRADVEEFTANWALSAADEALRHSVFAEGAGKEAVSEEKEKEFVDLALSADRLLASHPLDCLDRWVDMARAWGCSPEDADYYEADAKRQVTVWGGPVLSEYAAKMWSGLIRNYYVPRWVQWLEAKRAERPWDMGHFEEQWITTAGACGSEPYPDPLDAAVHLVEKLKSIKQIDLIKVYYGHTVGEWHSGETTEAYADRDWALPTNILSTGNLVVRFQYTAGADRLDIDGVRLLKNGVEVARDAHFGRTGDENVANVFHLHLPSVEAGAVYTLRAKIRSAGGSDSNGTIYLHVNR